MIWRPDPENTGISTSCTGHCTSNWFFAMRATRRATWTHRSSAGLVRACSRSALSCRSRIKDCRVTCCMSGCRLGTSNRIDWCSACVSSKSHWRLPSYVPNLILPVTKHGSILLSMDRSAGAPFWHDRLQSTALDQFQGFIRVLSGLVSYAREGTPCLERRVCE